MVNSITQKENDELTMMKQRQIEEQQIAQQARQNATPSAKVSYSFSIELIEGVYTVWRSEEREVGQ